MRTPRTAKKSSAADEFLGLLAERVKQTRARHGLTRRMLAQRSGVSERYLAEIESGQGNISVLVLQRLATALSVQLGELLVQGPESSAEFLENVELLRKLSQEDLKAARKLLQERFGLREATARSRRIALIGLRGAGKSSLGKALAEKLGMPFLELDQLIEKESGLTLSAIFDFRGQDGFRQLERQCLEDVLRRYPEFVMATGGSLVTEESTFERLLTSCFTVWIKASPEEHMQRVISQGDLRPMANHRNAMVDLRKILADREKLYRRADLKLETSNHSLKESLQTLVKELANATDRKF
jgi:XRE family transcriptional regulator, aerobic/anaerobic benzoate catabolism transcriptional regulator